MPGAEVIEIVLSWVVTTGLALLVVVVDERRLDDAARARAWPTVSRDAAIVAFGLLALPFHFAKTRGDWRSARGIVIRILAFAMGLVASGLVAIGSGLVLTAIAWALGLPTSD